MTHGEGAVAKVSLCTSEWGYIADKSKNHQRFRKKVGAWDTPTLLKSKVLLLSEEPSHSIMSGIYSSLPACTVQLISQNYLNVLASTINIEIC